MHGSASSTAPPSLVLNGTLHMTGKSQAITASSKRAITPDTSVRGTDSNLKALQMLTKRSGEHSPPFVIIDQSIDEDARTYWVRVWSVGPRNAHAYRWVRWTNSNRDGKHLFHTIMKLHHPLALRRRSQDWGLHNLGVMIPLRNLEDPVQIRWLRNTRQAVPVGSAERISLEAKLQRRFRIDRNVFSVVVQSVGERNAENFRDVHFLAADGPGHAALETSIRVFHPPPPGTADQSSTRLFSRAVIRDPVLGETIPLRPPGTPAYVHWSQEATNVVPYYHPEWNALKEKILNHVNQDPMIHRVVVESGLARLDMHDKRAWALHVLMVHSAGSKRRCGELDAAIQSSQIHLMLQNQGGGK
ncbi:hypothetical protein IE81DRAFT_330394 [Ceraceosorus guamensis]|uniref:Uncharacterized protein n=1 Tax=Ceraceosorus guamensis TaxID=1522189 RepID=A0A316VXD2_9BASI|nr:hypothetical protein IE81DRAFT_330394 [Ceraceosorus guamensis]PWN42112.1 hypothetical protein IE81DRAFT_330394 [Ceraceosorus guamensis]